MFSTEQDRHRSSATERYLALMRKYVRKGMPLGQGTQFEPMNEAYSLESTLGDPGQAEEIIVPVHVAPAVLLAAAGALSVGGGASKRW